MAMITAIILPCATITFNKVVALDFSYASAGTLPMPFWFMLGDIITEVYGYRVSRQIVWNALLCNLLFAVAIFILIRLPSPKAWTGESAYLFVLGDTIRLAISGLVALIIGVFINNYLISKWKVLVRGKYFWLRSIGSSTIGEAAYTLLAFFLIFLLGGHLNLHTMLIFVIWSYCFKFIGAILLAGPANLIANYLKKKEGIDIYDTNVNFNPFKVSTQEL